MDKGKYGKDEGKNNNGVLLGETKGDGFSKDKLILNVAGKITDSYKIDKKKLGEGSFGFVSQCTNKFTNSVRAVKTLMDHPNIVKLYESFEDQRNIYLVLELCVGGELFDRIIDLGHFTEVQAAIVMQHIFRAMFYMHEKQICHRDLKPENFLFMSKDPIEETTLKIIDFGLACRFSKDKPLTTKAGTAYYVAPQVLAGRYDHTADLWSCGVIMYVVLCGYPPFYAENDAEVMARVRSGNFEFKNADWKHISDDAKALIRNLLKMNPKERYTAEQSLNNVWVKMKAPKATNVALDSGLVKRLKGFRVQNRLKKAALHVIASQLSEDQISSLRDVFTALDANGDGLLTCQELKDGLEQAGFKELPPDLQQIMDDVDADGSGVIDYTEFLAATLEKKVYHQEGICWAAFRVFDRNGDGKISKEEVAHILGDGDVQSVACRDLAELMADVDVNGDGEIDFQEFMDMMRGGPASPKSSSNSMEMKGEK